jgi:hypothetical protein
MELLIIFSVISLIIFVSKSTYVGEIHFEMFIEEKSQCLRCVSESHRRGQGREWVAGSQIYMC